MPNARKSPALRSRWTHLSREGPPPLAHIDQRQHGEGAVGVLGQAATAGLGEAPQALEGQERMLDLVERTEDFLRLVCLSASLSGRFL